MADYEHEGETTSENAFPDAGEMPPARVVELNEKTMAYFEDCYPRSWAPSPAEHLGTDLREVPAHGVSFAVGYAPGGGRSLMRHLTAQGATLEELEQTGLVSRRERGRHDVLH